VVDDGTSAPLRGASVETRVLAVENGVGRERRDRVAGEEPLEIRAAGPRQEPVREMPQDLQKLLAETK